MKTASASLISFLDSTTAGTIRHLITVTPRAGAVVYWTDHTATLTYDAKTWLCGGEGTTAPIVVVGGSETVAGLEITTLDMELHAGTTALFNGTALPSAALAGLLDGAWVKVERAFGEDDLDLTMGTLHVFEGPVGNVKVTDYGVQLEVESAVALLRVPMPKVLFQPGCTNRVYDAQCALTRAAYVALGTVAAGATTLVIPSSLTAATGTTNTQGHYALGVLTFSTGPLTGTARGVRSYALVAGVGTFTLDRPLPSAPVTGNGFNVYPGCPKTLAACINNTAAAGPLFNNKTHFRGFPFVPQNETGG